MATSTVLGGLLSARYSGRVDAELSFGHAVLLVRDPATGGDGSVVVLSSASGVLPRNWACSGSELEWTRSGLVATHHKKGERLEVFISELMFRKEIPADLDPHLEKIGREKDVADLLAQHASFLGDGDLELIGREIRTDAGPMDILFMDGDRRPVVVEVKRKRCSVGDLWQLRKYLDAVRRDAQWGRRRPRGILVAPSTTRGLLETLKDDEDVDFVRLSFEDVKHLHVVRENPAD